MGCNKSREELFVAMMIIQGRSDSHRELPLKEQ